MCEMCDKVTGETAGCQDCGTPICFDDGTAGVSAAGDVYCASCARAADEAEESEWDHTWDFYGKAWYDPDATLPDYEDDPLIYIGPDDADDEPFDEPGEDDDFLWDEELDDDGVYEGDVVIHQPYDDEE